MKKIGIVVAMRIEGADFMEKLGKCEIIDLYKGFLVKKFLFSDKEIYFIESGVGELRAAICAQMLIDRFGVEAIVNFGVVGGLKEGMRGKTYCVSGVAHYEFDTSVADGNPRGKYEIFDSAVIPCDERIVSLIKKIDGSIESVICASGDKFVADEDFKRGLIKDFNASICEMESAGIIMAAKRSGIPCGFVKIVSDDGDHADEFFDFIEHMKDELSKIVIPLIVEL